jgi:hypothetical protein
VLCRAIANQANFKNHSFAKLIVNVNVIFLNSRAKLLMKTLQKTLQTQMMVVIALNFCVPQRLLHLPQARPWRLLVTIEATQELKDWVKGETAPNLPTVQKYIVLKLKAFTPLEALKD